MIIYDRPRLYPADGPGTRPLARTYTVIDLTVSSEYRALENG